MIKFLFFYFSLGFKMKSVYFSIFKAIAPAIIAILRTEAAKTESEIDDKLVNVFEATLQEFKII